MRVFKVVNNSDLGETNNETIFNYFQDEDRIWATYKGGSIVQGQLLGKVNAQGVIDMRYHHINVEGLILTGKCISTPELLENSKIILHEVWEWTGGKLGKGFSTIEEL